MTRVSLVEEVTQSLLERLGNGQYLPDEQMPTEQELCAELNVSRSCIREAMRTLELLNVVEVRHGTGTFVKNSQPNLLIDPKRFRASVEPNQLLNLLELRRIVEVESAALAAERATPEDLALLEQDVLALAVGVAQHRRPAEDMGFHLHLTAATHNPSIVEIARWIVAFYELDPLIPDQRDLEAHRRIYEAVRDRLPDAARLAMREHLDEVASRFRALINGH